MCEGALDGPAGVVGDGFATPFRLGEVETDAMEFMLGMGGTGYSRLARELSLFLEPDLLNSLLNVRTVSRPPELSSTSDAAESAENRLEGCGRDETRGGGSIAAGVGGRWWTDGAARGVK